MGVVQLSDELKRVSERQVADGRVASPTAFLKEAVMRLIDESRLEEDEVLQAVHEGLANVEAGRYTTVTTAEDGQFIEKRRMAKLQARLATGE